LDLPIKEVLKPFISIIIPAYNEESYLPHCLQGVFELEYPKDRMEVIVVDNESTDRTKEIALSYGCRVLDKPEGTIASVRNFGVREAISNEYIAFIDSDCIPHKNWLKACIEHMNDPHIGAITTSVADPPENGTWVEKAWCAMGKSSRHLDIAETKSLSSFSIFIRWSLFYELGGFNEELITCEDADLGYRLSEKCKIIEDWTVPTIHLRESKTLLELFKREKWRGIGNLRGLRMHGLKIREAPSIILPAIFVLSISVNSLLFAIWITTGNFGNWLMLISVLSLIMPNLMMLKKMKARAISLKYLHYYCLCAVYLIARGFSLIRSDWLMADNSKR
jgi:glycosyltransferase involved in cell wall biosynthesis